MLNPELIRDFIGALQELPTSRTRDGRDVYLNGLPANALNRNENNAYVDLSGIINDLDRMGRLKGTGVRPLIVLVDNAMGPLPESDAKDKLRSIKTRLEEHYQQAAPAPVARLSLVPKNIQWESVIGPRDERLPAAFFQGASNAVSAVARLAVKPIVSGSEDRDPCLGTGWLLAPGLLLTNYHVLAARAPDEDSPAPDELNLQAENMKAWFDYHGQELDSHRIECRGATLLAHSPFLALDYALLRLNCPAEIMGRRPLAVAERSPRLKPGDRLNILQHPNGGPLQCAIRNNRFIQRGTSDHEIWYLTDTSIGASGSPVLNDDWQVVALHHASRTLDAPQQYQHRTIENVNEGLAIHKILTALPSELREEVRAAQRW